MRRVLLAATAVLALMAASVVGIGVGVGVAADLSVPPTSQVVVVGVHPWREGWRGFGGWSGIDLAADGTQATILGDRTQFLLARLNRDAQGAIASVDPDWPVMLTDATGAWLDDERADSEGLAVADDGTVYVSFEDATRVRREGRDGLAAEELPIDPAFGRLPRNGGLEALAVDAGGTLYTLPETPTDGAFPVWRLAPGARAWEEAFRFPERDGFVPTGADIGPDGRLTILERRFLGVGFRSRLRRVALDGSGEETLWTTGTGDFDNLESVAIWRDDAGLYGGGLRATLISDDNFRFFQQTQFVDLRLPD